MGRDAVAEVAAPTAGDRVEPAAKVAEAAAHAPDEEWQDGGGDSTGVLVGEWEVEIPDGGAHAPELTRTLRMARRRPSPRPGPCASESSTRTAIRIPTLLREPTPEEATDMARPAVHSAPPLPRKTRRVGSVAVRNASARAAHARGAISDRRAFHSRGIARPSGATVIESRDSATSSDPLMQPPHAGSCSLTAVLRLIILSDGPRGHRARERIREREPLAPSDGTCETRDAARQSCRCC